MYLGAGVKARGGGKTKRRQSWIHCHRTGAHEARQLQPHRV